MHRIIEKLRLLTVVNGWLKKKVADKLNCERHSFQLDYYQINNQMCLFYLWTVEIARQMTLKSAFLNWNSNAELSTTLTVNIANICATPALRFQVIHFNCWLAFWDERMNCVEVLQTDFGNFAKRKHFICVHAMHMMHISSICASKLYVLHILLAGSLMTVSKGSITCIRLIQRRRNPF